MMKPLSAQPAKKASSTSPKCSRSEALLVAAAMPSSVVVPVMWVIAWWRNPR
jgi:hypothetical protein